MCLFQRPQSRTSSDLFVASRVITPSILLLTLLYSVTYSQCIVSQDESKRIITTCQADTPAKNSFLINRTDRGPGANSIVYLGSPYLTYPIYQNGTLEIAATKQIIPCKVALNLVANEVTCLLPGSNAEQAVLPDAFTVNEKRFVSRIESGGKRQYYEVLYAGKTNVLVHYKSTLTFANKEPYQVDETFDGTYAQQESYFIELAGKAPQKVTLSRKVVQKVLDTASNAIVSAKTKDKLTLMELIEAVASYDGFQ